jgi:hypothetical protein
VRSGFTEKTRILEIPEVLHLSSQNNSPVLDCVGVDAAVRERQRITGGFHGKGTIEIHDRADLHHAGHLHCGIYSAFPEHFSKDLVNAADLDDQMFDVFVCCSWPMIAERV